MIIKGLRDKKVIWFVLTVFTCQFLLYVSASAGLESDTLIPETWFDDALFIGDSGVGALNTYNLINGGLGNSTIYHVNGISCHNIVEKGKMLGFKGRNCTFEEVISISGAKKVFIMLAMNDIGHTDQEVLSSWEVLVDRIQKKCPEVDIFIQSCTPVAYDFGLLTKENVYKYNLALREVCLHCECTYIDITKGMADENGYLKQEYQKDNVHLNSNGCEVWVKNLKDPESYFPIPVI